MNLPELNPFFLGRNSLFAEIEAGLAANGRVALSGMGGIGKTRTAIEYARKHASAYSTIFWVSAASREALTAGYATVAPLLGLAESSDQTKVVQAVQASLAASSGWLLILDNADDIAMAREFIPGGSGHILLTTCAHAVGSLARLVEVRELSPDDATLFLLRRSKSLPADATMDQAAASDQAVARRIAVDLLGRLPLALDQAGAFIEESHCGLTVYEDLYKKRAPELLMRRGNLIDEYSMSVATTWSLSFERIEAANPAAADLLRFSAFLAPDEIPEELLTKGAPDLGPALSVAAADALALNDALAEILKYSLIRRNPANKTLELHRLVQQALQMGMDEATRRVWAERVVRAVRRSFPEGDYKVWPAYERMLPQALAAISLCETHRLEFAEAAELMNDAGVYLSVRGYFRKAVPLYESAVDLGTKLYGPEHVEVATALHHLADLYDELGEYDKALELYERVLGIREKAFGPNRSEVNSVLNNMAVLHRNRGELDNFALLCGRVYLSAKRHLELDDPDFLSALSSIGVVHRDRREFAKARTLYYSVLAIRQRVLGADHPDVGETWNNLAGLHYNQDEYAEAETLYLRAIEMIGNALGPDHPRLATPLENYAYLLDATGRRGEAAKYRERAGAIREKWG